jgi:thiamine kinase-like enzyme
MVLLKNHSRIDQYGNFLTHTDFVPHNFRIKDGTLYLLDFSSLRFGNKHEGWARFLNFMTLHNRELETLLVSYVKDNRSEEELESLWLMRLFRLGEIITYYVTTLDKSVDNLLTLNQSRVVFWSEVLKAELRNERVAESIVEEYRQQRDQLRTEEEKVRQVGLH